MASGGGPQNDASQRRQGELQRERAAMRGLGLGFAQGQRQAGAVVHGIVGIDQRLPAPALRHADAVVVTRGGGEVAQHDEAAALAGTALVGQHRLRSVVIGDPGEAARVMVELMQRRVGAVGEVEVAHQTLHALVGRVQQRVPVEAVVGLPFRSLREFVAHEQQLLARMTEHIAEIGAQVGELLPAVAGHLGEQRAFAMHHFVVRERQHEVLVIGVHHAEGQLVVVVLAVHRVSADVAQAVVHPAHIPLVVKAQAAALQVVARRAADAGKGGGLFREGYGARPLHADGVVHAAQKVDGFEVLTSAELVGHPLTGRAAVVAVEHGGYGVHAQAVDVEALQPVQGVGHQIVAYFGAAEVVDQGVPVVVEALFRVGVFVQMCAVEVGQAMRVGWKVCRHPVENHAQSGFVRGIDQKLKVFGRAEARGGRIQADGLIAPGAVEGMFADRQQLQMGEAQVAGIGHQGFGQFAVAQPAPALHLAPRAQMHLVNADGCLEAIGLRHAGADGVQGRQALHDAGGVGSQFGAEGHRIGLLQQFAVLGEDLEFVKRALAHAGEEDFPHAAFAPQPHGVAAAVPAVEIADHRNAPRVGRPHRKACASHAEHLARMRAQTFVGTQMGAFGQQPGVGLAQHLRKAVGVFEVGHPVRIARLQGRPGHPQHIVEGLAAVAHAGAEYRGLVLPLQRGDRFAAGALDHLHAQRAGQYGIHPQRGAAQMHAEHAKRVGVVACGEVGDVVFGQHGEVPVQAGRRL